ncbi:catechol 2,3-dioxygenase-like lactoylglutathione lyase family enzyme [Xanthomonas arboricola]|jgi:catechol 2,3-dioxygenase-like lactoylglutathione lyase family enzyme|uniref:Glyoxalase n=1 Tax=Xanthomonas euroxanthea TaxID=2259622 RepID=A0A8E4MEP2_9XANT|nr:MULTISPECIES: VOC family protein [Xanthomonas]SYZ53255.1 glyoxalase [Xanthomonas arboricola pv. juglandis]MBB5768630.1 catechol 2,3-dioxygenase-like lactoylglutathione lyase family enzyme [Xanthomonas euroxanthea]NIK09542.1 catechol 2,3-dioxygenase-like lactoylglutathione lyase family enzyme [Xanthomonas euroxanthea]NJC38938.1 catechol 2,3-dioxygenase-like lactoylglutathione lyase family enzyme [Xanthomonas euroxanthea]CAD1795203.1 glyoxalase [Xanthomonas euroxanthea]
MSRRIALTTLLVADYDAAIAWYTGALGFQVLQDRPLDDGKRWVVIGPGGAQEAALLLAQPGDDAQRARIGDQTGGRVDHFLYTDDFWRDHAAMQAFGVQFLETPREEPYGTVVVFRDLYGTKWDLLEPKQ